MHPLGKFLNPDPERDAFHQVKTLQQASSWEEGRCVGGDTSGVSVSHHRGFERNISLNDIAKKHQLLLVLVGLRD